MWCACLVKFILSLKWFPRASPSPSGLYWPAYHLGCIRPHVLKKKKKKICQTAVSISSVCVCVLVAQSCRILCNPMDCSQPGSSIHGILQARILEWVAICFSRRYSWPRDGTRVSHAVGIFFTICATGASVGDWLNKLKHLHCYGLNVFPLRFTWWNPNTQSLPTPHGRHCLWSWGWSLGSRSWFCLLVGST